MELKVGDRVEDTELKFSATVFSVNDKMATLRRDDRETGVGDFIPDYGFGWAVRIGDNKDGLNSPLKIINKRDKMQTLNSFLKKILNKKQKVLYKAGFLNGDLKLTEEGRDALNAILYEQNEDALVQEAQEKIDEEKKEDC